MRKIASVAASALVVVFLLTWYECASVSVKSSSFEKPVADNVESGVSNSARMDVPPHYLQMDPRWKNLKYSEGTVETYGCGLTCAAAYVSYVTQDPEFGVDDMLHLVGDTCLTAGVNDMGKFCDFLTCTYGTKHTGQFWIPEDAIAYLDKGYMLFASLEGSILEGYRSYEGHIVLIYKHDSKGIWIMDPGDETFNVPIDEKVFCDVFSGQYFYAVRTHTVEK